MPVEAGGALGYALAPSHNDRGRRGDDPERAWLRRAFSVQAMHPIKDKRARLRVAARHIKNGAVKFPRTGCEQLLTQLLGFGIEKHDDAVDALVYLILGFVGEGIEEQKVHYV